MPENISEPFLWSHFKWFLGFVAPLLGIGLTGLIFFGNYALESHAEKGAHGKAVGTEKYETDQHYLKRDIENLAEGQKALQGQITEGQKALQNQISNLAESQGHALDILENAQRTARDEILEKLNEVKRATEK